MQTCGLNCILISVRVMKNIKQCGHKYIFHYDFYMIVNLVLFQPACGVADNMLRPPPWTCPSVASTLLAPGVASPQYVPHLFIHNARELFLASEHRQFKCSLIWVSGGLFISMMLLMKCSLEPLWAGCFYLRGSNIYRPYGMNLDRFDQIILF